MTQTIPICNGHTESAYDLTQSIKEAFRFILETGQAGKWQSWLADKHGIAIDRDPTGHMATTSEITELCEEIANSKAYFVIHHAVPPRRKGMLGIAIVNGENT